jgi:hypothetical protein
LPPEVPGPTLWNKAIGALEKLARKLAWLNLAYQFAVRPTISDAKRLVDLMDSYKRRLSQLITEADKLQKRHYSRLVDGYNLPSEIVVSDQSNWNDNKVWRRAVWLSRPRYRATMVFTYDASKLRTMLGQIDNLLHALGVQKVASIIWEAIPYSFVVDWFVNVGDMIASAEAQLLEPLPILVHDFSASLKLSYKTRLEIVISHLVLPAFYVRSDLAWREFTTYERRRDFPSLWDSLSARLPNLNQVGLGSSLIVMRMVGVTKERRR